MDNLFVQGINLGIEKDDLIEMFKKTATKFRKNN